MPLIALWIIGGVILTRHEWAVRAVAGTVAVSFGAFQTFGKHQIRPMLVTLVGIAIATFAGSMAGYFGWVAMTITATAWGVLFGAMTGLGFSIWWVGLQWTIALLVYGAHASGPTQAIEAALGVFVGGGVQLVFLAIVLPLTSGWFHRRVPLPDEDADLLNRFALHANPFSQAGRYGLRVAIALSLGTVIGHFWGTTNAYWVPMTAAILLKPDLHETITRGVSRLIATLAGVGIPTILLALAQPSPMQLGVLLLVAIYCSFVLQRVNYALFGTAITAYVVLLLSLLGLPEPEVVVHRVYATLMGAGIALLAHLVPLNLQFRPRSQVERSINVGAASDVD